MGSWQQSPGWQQPSYDPPLRTLAQPRPTLETPPRSPRHTSQTLPPGAAPSAMNATSPRSPVSRASIYDDQRTSRAQIYVESAGRVPPYTGARTAPETPAQSNRLNGHSEPKPIASPTSPSPRNPIVPALASPPRQRPQRASSTGPYPVTSSQEAFMAEGSIKDHGQTVYGTPHQARLANDGKTPRLRVSSRRSTSDRSTPTLGATLRSPISTSSASVNMPSSTPVSEASAYARAVSNNFRSSPVVTTPEKQSLERATTGSNSRPLPRPPKTPGPTSPTPVRHPSQARDSKTYPGQGQANERPRPTTQDVTLDARSNPLPTSPKLSTRQSGITINGRETVSHITRPAPQVDTSVTNLAYPNIVTSPTPESSSPSRNVKRQTFIVRPPGPIQLSYLLAHAPIQASLLSFLSINSFLGLTGASETLRSIFTGEQVGRWILQEWGFATDRERGRGWPNLTVWEGFLESLLHDPASYSTYPPRWHNLLRHLSLSHTLIVLHLRSMPSSSFPSSAALPFDDESFSSTTRMPDSRSVGSLSAAAYPRSRVGSITGSEAGSPLRSMPPKKERLMEIIMPEPLAVQPPREDRSSVVAPSRTRPGRRNSISSIASSASLVFGRRRSSTMVNDQRPNIMPTPVAAAPIVAGKAVLPPVSFPSAKRYAFRRHPPNSSGTSVKGDDGSSRPGSIFSVQTSASVALSQWVAVTSNPTKQSLRSRGTSVPNSPVTIPKLVTGGGHSISPSPRASIAGSETTAFSRASDFVGRPSSTFRRGSPANTRAYMAPPARIEAAFDRPPPYSQGRAPLLRVFVPIPEQVSRWPSAEGAAAALKELDKCGATKRLKLGDLIINTGYKNPKSTEHVLLFVPFVKHRLVPLEYRHSKTGHLPAYLDGFSLPPSYYHPFLPTPHILYLNLAPFARAAQQAIRLAFDRRDVTVSSGARLSAKRYLHVTGFQVTQMSPVAPEWEGMVTLEADGTAEGKAELSRRLGGGDPNRAVMGAWELLREKSMAGSMWLRLVKDVT